MPAKKKPTTKAVKSKSKLKADMKKKAPPSSFGGWLRMP
jgi:hypothetical protein